MQSLFSTRLKMRRKKLRLTQEQLAEKCGLTPAAISQYESDERKPSHNTLKNLSSTLYVTTDYLIGIKEIETEDFLADKRISEMLEGMLTLPEKQKNTLLRFYEGLAILHEREKNRSGLPSHPTV